MHATPPLLASLDFPPIRRRLLDTRQVHLGCWCGQGSRRGGALEAAAPDALAMAAVGMTEGAR